MNFYKHHIGDYDADTSHLSWHEDLAYSRLLRLYYRSERPIPTDISQACRLVRAVSKQERQAVNAVLREYFRLHDDGWHNKRCDEELTKWAEQSDTNRRIASEREQQRRARIAEKAATNRVTNRAISGNEPLHESSTFNMVERKPNQKPEPEPEPERTLRAGSDSPKDGEPPIPPKTRKKPATKCPEGFAVTDEMYGWANTRGLQAHDVEQETEKFLLYHGSKGSLFSDWHQAWMNWLLKSVEFRAQRRSTA